MIEVNKVSKEYYHDKNRINAVSDISFRCLPGRIMGLIGPNGAGKTTTLRMIATLLSPTKGSIYVCGYNTVNNKSKIKQRIGFLTSLTSLYRKLTSSEIIDYFGALHNISANDLNRRKAEIFSRLSINDYKNKYISKLSTGMKQKISLARIFINNPEVLILDEPTIGLDIISSKEIFQIVKNYRDEGKTIILSTHRIEEIKLLCDDIVIIHNGKQYFSGSLSHFVNTMKYDTIEEELIFMLK